jgi:hypothetical protein
MGVVFAAAQRLFAGQGPEYQDASLLIGDRQEAALDRRYRQGAIESGFVHSA